MLFKRSKDKPAKEPTKFSDSSVGKGEGALQFVELKVALFQQNDELWIAYYEDLSVSGMGTTPAEALVNGWNNWERRQ